MSTNIFQQAIFGVYEILSDIIPGFIILITTFSFFYTYLPKSIPESLYIVSFIFISFIIGQIIHCIASNIEGYINNIKYGGYPSALFMTNNNNTFPQYFKDNIRQQLYHEYGTPLDSDPQHVFDLCYTFVTQNNLSNRVMIFLNMYTFSRNMMLVTIIEGIYLGIISYVTYNANLWLMSMVVIISSYFFYHRFIRYAESFAKEVLRSYFINRVVKVINKD